MFNISVIICFQGNIRVFCRVRPLINDEVKANGDSKDIEHINFLDNKTLELCKSSGEYKWLMKDLAQSLRV